MQVLVQPRLVVRRALVVVRVVQRVAHRLVLFVPHGAPREVLHRARVEARRAGLPQHDRHEVDPLGLGVEPHRVLVVARRVDKLPDLFAQPVVTNLARDELGVVA